MSNRLVALLILAVPLAASAQVAPRRTQLDSAKVADLLSRLRSADSVVCQLAGTPIRYATLSPTYSRSGWLDARWACVGEAASAPRSRASPSCTRSC